MTMQRFERVSPESVGVDPDALRKFVTALDQVRDVHSVMVLRRGKVVAEGWWHPYRPDQRHQLFSVSKSFTSTAVGIAIEEGLLSLDDRVIDLLPEDVPSDPSENLAAMTVRHLLTMTSGHGTDTMNFAFDDLDRPRARWARFMLAAPVQHKPGTHFVYNTGATYLLAAILHRLTGQRLLDYLTPRLFEPLGIEGATWEQDPQGIDVGGFGLSTTTEDIAAFGQVWLQRGVWQGKQLVPAAWVDAASAPQVWNGPNDQVDWEQGYGFQFWRCRNDAYRGDGAFGQFVVVWPEHEAVVVITAGTGNMSLELDAVWDTLGEAFGEPTTDPTSGDGALTFPGLTVRLPDGESTAPIEELVLGSHFVLDEEVHGVRSVALRRSGDDELEIVWSGGHHPGAAPERSLRCGVGHWAEGVLGGGGDEALEYAGAAAWSDAQTLSARVLRLGTPFALEITARFGGDAEGRWVEIAVDQNVSFGSTELARVTGRGGADA